MAKRGKRRVKVTLPADALSGIRVPDPESAAAAFAFLSLLMSHRVRRRCNLTKKSFRLRTPQRLKPQLILHLVRRG